jgi:hypothetical protein
MKIEDRQLKICQKFGASFAPSPSDQKVGMAANIKSGLIPINGLRHMPYGDTTGWYIWAGETLSQEDDFFLPLHVSHIGDWCPVVNDYLGLAPGWRFLIAGDYVDVWFDEKLLTEHKWGQTPLM